MTLYSLDGVTWSSRPEELQAIVDRHNCEKANFSSDLKGEERPVFKTKHPDTEEGDGEDREPPIEEEDADIVVDDDETPSRGKRGAPQPMRLVQKKGAAPIKPVPGKPSKVQPAVASKGKQKAPAKKLPAAKAKAKSSPAPKKRPTKGPAKKAAKAKRKAA